MAAIIPSAQPFEEEDTTVYSKVTFWTRLRRHKLAVAGIVVLGLIALCAILAPLLAPFDPNAIDNVHWQGTPLPPCFQDHILCAGHPLGTDAVGRDLLSRLLFGARISLQIGIFTVLFEVIIGVIVGAFAGYYGGWVDWVMMRITDVFLSIPLLPLLLVLTAIVAISLPGVLGGAIVTETIFAWPGAGRMFYSALQQSDIALMMGYLLILAVAVVFANLLADVLYAWLDPRVKYD